MNLATRRTSSDSPRWSLLVLLLVPAGAGAAFVARTLARRRAQDPGEGTGDP